MRPGDHPEFFLRPPPPGRSRESTIRLDAEGRFWHEGNLVEHEGMARAFASWVDRHPHDGRYILNNGYDWSYFEVEDAPCWVRGVVRVGQGLELELLDGSREPLDAATLGVNAEGALSCLVRDGRFSARFLRGAQLALGPYLVETPEGNVVLRLGEQDFPVRSAPTSG